MNLYMEHGERGFMILIKLDPRPRWVSDVEGCQGRYLTTYANLDLRRTSNNSEPMRLKYSQTEYGDHSG